MSAARTDRWEGERGSWLLAHSSPGTGSRRRSEMLTRRSRTLERTRHGITGSALQSDISTKTLYRRLLMADDDAAEQLARTVLVSALYGVVWIAVGGAIGIAAGLYAAMWALSPRIGRLWRWPWIAACVLVGVGGALVLDLGGVVEEVVYPRWVIDVHWDRLLVTWGWSQVVIGLLFVALQIHRCGWAAVPRHAVTRRAKRPASRPAATRLRPTAERKERRSRRHARKADKAAVAPVEPDSVVDDDVFEPPTYDNDEPDITHGDDEPDIELVEEECEPIASA